MSIFNDHGVTISDPDKDGEFQIEVSYGTYLKPFELFELATAAIFAAVKRGQADVVKCCAHCPELNRG